MAHPAGYGQVRFVHALTSDPEEMITTIGVASPAAPGSLELTFIYDSWNTNIVPWLNDEYVFRGLQVSGATSGAVEYDVEVFSTSTGGSAGASLPQNCAVLVQKRTGLAGRANRGRMYVPGLAQEAEIAANGILDPSFQADLQTAFDAFLDDLTETANTGITNAVIIHPTGTPTPVANLVVDDVIATQRRRLR